MKQLRFGITLVLTLTMLAGWAPCAAQDTEEGLTDEIPLTAKSAGAPPPAGGPATFRAGDGHEIPIQRDWSTEEDPTRYESMALDQQPFRFDQRQPSHVYTEQRPGQQPLYYFKDVRWYQSDRAEGAKFGRKAFFTTVRVDLEKVKAAWFCMKPFAPKFVAGHAALLLEFEPGGFVNLDGQESPGFVLSYEAYLKASQRYGMIGGQFSRKFRIVYVVSTWHDFLVRSIRFNGSIVKRWKLSLDKTQLQHLSVAIGKVVLADHSAERYNTTRASCVTAALELAMSILPPERRSPEKWLWGLIQNPGWALPVFADNVLRNKGLIRDPKETIKEVPMVSGATAAAPNPADIRLR
ncbi:MAG: DUF4105 domain-containing protein [Candidatus Wallbacteria bacterium]|nr:DUF4105 domain-containing protein [Candidatus Wallbacteria bacterium]